jgi:hypothetical protein
MANASFPVRILHPLFYDSGFGNPPEVFIRNGKSFHSLAIEMEFAALDVPYDVLARRLSRSFRGVETSDDCSVRQLPCKRLSGN